jgi:YbbR domain-containing protein
MMAADTLKSLITKNLFAKVFSLLTAILVVWLVRQDSIREADITVPLKLLMPKEESLLLEQPPTEITVRLRGAWSVLSSILQNPPKAYLVDLSTLGGGETFSFSAEALEEHLNVKGATGIASIYPPSLTLQMDRLESRSLKVKPEIKGAPDSFSYVDYSRIEVIPAEVLVKGPASVLARIPELSTRTVDVSGFSGVREVKVPLEAPNGLSITMYPDSVLLRSPVREKAAVKAVVNVPLKVMGCPAGFVCTSEPPLFSVRISGDERVLGDLSRETLSQYIFIDAGTIRPPDPERYFEVFGPLEPRIQGLAGAQFELDPQTRFFKVRLQRREPK